MILEGEYIFDGSKQDVWNLLQDPEVLSRNDDSDDRRITIFEEFSNGGLQVLQEELKGVQDPLDTLILLMEECKEPAPSREAEELSGIGWIPEFDRLICGSRGEQAAIRREVHTVGSEGVPLEDLEQTAIGCVHEPECRPGDDGHCHGVVIW